MCQAIKNLYEIFPHPPLTDSTDIHSFFSGNWDPLQI